MSQKSFSTNTGKVIIITGASKGIGKSIAELLSQNHKIILVARDTKTLEELASNIKKNGGIVEAIAGDVTKEDQVRNVVAKTLEKFQTIDVLINNAGIGLFKRVDEFTIDEFNEILNINLFGTFLFTKYVVPILIKKKAGQIINIASIAGLTGFKGGTAYAASKFGQVGFTESLREDLKQYGIAVTAVCPGGVNTSFGGDEINEKGIRDYLLEPEDVARAVEYLVNESETANTKLLELKPRRRKEKR
ncbi:MAG: SDR family oxidoreductase [Candidatus Hodarchaeales archaeon]|jgi:3-oxoacyl-[acyl-carrier protein] reductase